MDTFVEKIKRNKNSICFFSIIGISFILIYLLNLSIPLFGDDFDYSFIYGTNEKVTTIGDIFQSQWIHYFTWGGRSIVHFIVQFFVLIGKDFFHVCNALMYVLFTLCIYFHCTGKKQERWNCSLLILIHLCLWFCQPVFGEVFLWLTGSCNYLWGTTIILAFLLPFRFSLENQPSSASHQKNFSKIIGMFLFGILAGWTNENTAAAMIGIIFLFLFLKKFRKETLPGWYFSGLIGSIIGFSLMIAAPGNYIRSQYFASEDSLFTKLSNRLIEMIEMAPSMIGTLSIIAIILFLFYQLFHFKKIANAIYLVYFLGGFASILAMLASPYFPERAWFGSSAFLLIGLGTLANTITIKQHKGITYLFYLLLIFFLAWGGRRYLMVLQDNFSVLYQLQQREFYIQQEKQKGNYDIIITTGRIVPNYPVYNCYLDSFADAQSGINLMAAKFYGVNSISIRNQ